MEKESREMKNLKKLARERLLTGQYGKYDYVEDLLESEYIIKTKPRKIRLHISKMLEIPEEQINQQTFFSWLRNYKKREEKNAKGKKDSSSLNNQNLSEKNINDPSNFTPTDPRILDKKREEDYFKNLIKVPDLS